MILAEVDQNATRSRIELVDSTNPNVGGRGSCGTTQGRACGGRSRGAVARGPGCRDARELSAQGQEAVPNPLVNARQRRGRGRRPSQQLPPPN